MTLAAFRAAVEGYVEAQGSKPDQAEVTDDEFLAALAEEQAAGRA